MRVGLEAGKNKTTVIAVLLGAGAIVARSQGLIDNNTCAQLVALALVAIVGRDTARKLMALLAALGDDDQRVDVVDGTARIRTERRG